MSGDKGMNLKWAKKVGGSCTYDFESGHFVRFLLFNSLAYVKTFFVSTFTFKFVKEFEYLDSSIVFAPGLPDFSWYNISKRGKLLQNYQMPIEYTNWS
jgi:hypothetical protein